MNPSIATGEIEVQVAELEILSRSTALPFQLDEEGVDETLRIRYRWLDLRRERLQRNIRTRARAVSIIRQEMEADGFVDIETPIMGKPTPEGARDFLIPTRLQPGRFFALPQSPQIYKQLLVIAGFERYYQIARCFRDEDLRADRLQELTQLDVEMAFPDLDELFTLVERIVARIWRECRGVELETPFPRMQWDEADLRYGSDKPDLRFGLEIEDATAVTRGSEFGVFANAKAVRYLSVPKELSRSELAKLEEVVKGWGAKGLASIVFRTDGEISSPIAKFLAPEVLDAVRSPGRTVLFAAGEPGEVSRILGFLRLHLGRELGLVDESLWRFTWVTDFPMLKWDADLDRWDAEHHPFTRPTADSLPCSTPIRARRGPSPTTSSATASSWRADRSGSTSPSFRRRSSTCSGSRPRSSARSSASCSTRSRWVRRPTAGSRPESTGCAWPSWMSRSSATRSRFRRTRPGSTRCPARRPR